MAQRAGSRACLHRRRCPSGRARRRHGARLSPGGQHARGAGRRGKRYAAVFTFSGEEAHGPIVPRVHPSTPVAARSGGSACGVGGRDRTNGLPGAARHDRDPARGRKRSRRRAARPGGTSGPSAQGVVCHREPARSSRPARHRPRGARCTRRSYPRAAQQQHHDHSSACLRQGGLRPAEEFCANHHRREHPHRSGHAPPCCPSSRSGT